jgi:hypothetical protein
VAEPRTIKAIYDNREQVVHVPSMLFANSAYPRITPLRAIENIDDFVAWLNAKAKTERFTVVTATPLAGTARGGIGWRYAEYLKGKPEARIRAAIKEVMTHDRVGVVCRAGVWEVNEATMAIRTIAEDAKVSFNEARTAYLAFLRAELGDIVDRMTFPPENAARTLDEADDAPYPVEL